MDHLDKDDLPPSLDTRAGAATSPSAQPPSGPVNCYAVLDVAPTAARVEIREAYLRLKNTYGGDGAALYSLIDESEAKSQLGLVEEAYRVLYDDTLRREHDLRLGIARPTPRSEAHANASHSSATAYLQTAVTDSGVERLLLAREREAAQALGAKQLAKQREAEVGDETPDAGVVRTQRSTLPIISLRAQRTAGDDLKTQMQAIIDASDAGDGDLFKRLRELAQVTEEELQERTKVSIGYIRAIELNRFDRLPQAVYVKGFLQAFFRYMAVPDADRLTGAFSQRLIEWQVANRKG